ncbi:MAG: hypothetical protein AAB536_02065 [Patescibacteria group bacterium]
MSSILKNIPKNLEDGLFTEYTELKRRFQLNDVGPSQLNGGRLAEVILRIFQHLLKIPVSPFENEIKTEEKTRILNKVISDATIDIHIRQKVSSIARMLLDFRNNRNVAHLGGFSANSIDAQFVLSSSNWIIAEFIRVFGNYSLEDAQELIDSIAVPTYPVIFDIEGDDFIARDDLTVKEEVLVLVCIKKRDFNFLFAKTKDKNKSRFKKTLESLGKEKKIVLKNGLYHILPNGIKEVQEKNLLKLN